MRKILCILVSILFFNLLIPSANSSVTCTISGLGIEWLKNYSEPTAILGLDLTQTNNEKLQSIALSFDDIGNDLGFTSGHLMPLDIDAESGVALYVDNKNDGLQSYFDENDTIAILSEKPSWSGLNLTLKPIALSLPPNNTGKNSGNDFFIVLKTSGKAKTNDDFKLTIPMNGIVASLPLPITFTSDLISFDTEEPKANAGKDIEGKVGIQIAFDGSFSEDNIGLKSYKWDFGDSAIGFGAKVSHVYKNCGRYNVVLNVSDFADNYDEDSLIVNIICENKKPIILSKPFEIAYEDSFYQYQVVSYDPDGDDISFSLGLMPKGMRINEKGIIEWLPKNNDVGQWDVAVYVNDTRGGSGYQFFRINVINVNDAPVFLSKPPEKGVQGLVYLYFPVVEDEDGDVLFYSLIKAPKEMEIDRLSGKLRWLPSAYDVGENEVIICASDLKNTTNQSFKITVENRNDAPIFLSEPIKTAIEGKEYIYKVLAEDFDKDELFYFLTEAPKNMKVSQNGTISWIPDKESLNREMVTIGIRDSNMAVAYQSFFIDVFDLNDAPILLNKPKEYAYQDIEYTDIINVFDYEGENINFELIKNNGMEIRAINSSSALLSWTPKNDDVGENDFALLLSDGKNNVYVNFSIYVINKNDNPVFIDAKELINATENVLFTFYVKAYDPDNEKITYSIVSGKPTMELDKDSGLFKWLPVNKDVGFVNITIEAKDEEGARTLQSFSIYVSDVNNPPTIAHIPFKILRIGEVYKYKIKAEDLDNDNIKLRVEPKIFEIKNNEIKFKPKKEGVYSVKIIASDGIEETNQTLEFIVEKRNIDTRVFIFGLIGFAFYNKFALFALIICICLFIIYYVKVRYIEKAIVTLRHWLSYRR